jgi:hypothetical protein
MRWRMVPRPVRRSPIQTITVLLNFEEPGAVLLPLLGRRSWPPGPKNFEEFIHLSPRQIYRVGAVQGGIEILSLRHHDHSLAADHPNRGRVKNAKGRARRSLSRLKSDSRLIECTIRKKRDEWPFGPGTCRGARRWLAA